MSTIKGMRTDNEVINFANVFTGAFPKLEAAISGVSAKWNSDLTGMARVSETAGTAIKGLWGIIRAHPLIAIAAAVGSVVLAFNHLSKAGERANEAMNGSVSAYKKSADEVASLNTELETTQARIDELRAIDSLSFVEQAELEKLQQLNDKLLIQKQIKEDIAAADAREAIKDTVSAYEKNFKTPITPEKAQEYYDIYQFSGNAANLLSDSKDIAGMLTFLKIAQENMDAAQEGSEEWLNWSESIENVRDQLFVTGGAVNELEGYLANLSIVPFEKLSKKAQTAYTNISNALDYIYQIVEPGVWKENHLNSIFADSEFADIKQELIDIAKEMGGLNAETLSSNQFAPFVAACEKAGIGVEDLIGEINKLAGIEIFDQEEIRQQMLADYTDFVLPENNSEHTLEEIYAATEKINADGLHKMHSLRS